MEIILRIFVFCICVMFLGFIIYIGFIFYNNARRNRKLPPYVNSFGSHLKLLDKYNWSQGSKMLDLGCGDGGTLRYIYHRHCLTLGVGYDINTFAIKLGQIINNLYVFFGKKQNIILHENNIYNANLSGYDYIYIYLFPDFMSQIEDWLRTNADKNTIIISNTFFFAKHEPYQIIKNTKGQIIYRFYKT